MQIITLYRYTRPDGGTSVSPVKPDCEYVERYRLIADEGKMLVNGEFTGSCVDVENTEGWTEIDVPEELTE